MPRIASSRAGDAPTIVSNVPDAVAKRCPSGPVPVVVFAFAAGFAPPARIVPPELLFVVGVVPAAINSLLSHSGSHADSPNSDTVGPLAAAGCVILDTREPVTAFSTERVPIIRDRRARLATRWKAAVHSGTLPVHSGTLPVHSGTLFKGVQRPPANRMHAAGVRVFR